MTRLILLSSHAPPVEVRCDGCRHWMRFPIQPLPIEWGDCRLAETADALMHSYDGVRVCADFGCPRFEAKE